MEQLRSWFWRLAFALFLFSYAAVLLRQLNYGLASFDAHAVVKVTRELVDNHHLEVSRPPGHPTTEFYLFGTVAWILRHAFGLEFTDRAYLVWQGLGGIVALCLFYEFLRSLQAPAWKAFVASVCLGLSAQFFSNTVDGEEFVFAVLFLILSVRLLIVKETSGSVRLRLFLSIFSFALATGCRPEAVFAGFIFPVYCLFRPELGWKYAVSSILGETIMITIVWLPVLVIGLQPPYTAGMNVREAILGGCYRLIFQCFTVPVFLVFCWIIIQSFREWRQRLKDSFPQNFIFAISLVASLIFALALFIHASKPAHVIFVVPFLLLLAAQRSRAVLVSLALLTILGCLVSIDIFKERKLVPPFPVAGSYYQATRQKPVYKMPYVIGVLEQCEPWNTVIITDLWRWDIQYLVEHHAFLASEQNWKTPTGDEVSVFLSGVHGCYLLPRDAALYPSVIESVRSRNDIQTVKMDRLLYRTLFMRYDITGTPPRQGRIGNIPVQLISITPVGR